MFYEFFIARRYLRSSRKGGFISFSTYISVGGVTVGVAALIIVLSVMNGFETEVRDRIVSTDAHIRVLTSDNRGIRDYERIVASLEKREHVLAAVPFVYAESMLSFQGRSVGARVLGVDPRIDEVTDLRENLRCGDLVFWVPGDGRDSPGAILGMALADRLGVGVGDRITVLGAQGGEGFSPWPFTRVRRFVVTGLFETGLYDYDASLVYIPLRVAQSLFQTGETVTGIGLRVDDIYSAQRVAQQITRELGYPFLALSWMEQNRTLFNWMTIEKWALFLALSLIILVAAFNIISTLVMLVMELLVALIPPVA